MTGDGLRERATELLTALHEVESRIASACADAGRRREDVTLIVVTKFFPASDIQLLAEAGVAHVAESRHQEALAKWQHCRELPLTWHFVGRLQSNKAAAVGRWADVVQSVDRVKVLPQLSRAAHERDRALDVLVQVSLDEPDDEPRDEPGDEPNDRSGVAPGDAVALALAAASAEGLRPRGVMAVAPQAADPAVAFARLRRIAEDIRGAVPEARWMSAGMSGDLEAAIAAGATHVRVGTAVLGLRPPPG